MPEQESLMTEEAGRENPHHWVLIMRDYQHNGKWHIGHMQYREGHPRLTDEEKRLGFLASPVQYGKPDYIVNKDTGERTGIFADA